MRERERETKRGVGLERGCREDPRPKYDTFQNVSSSFDFLLLLFFAVVSINPTVTRLARTRPKRGGLKDLPGNSNELRLGVGRVLAKSTHSQEAYVFEREKRC